MNSGIPLRRAAVFSSFLPLARAGAGGFLRVFIRGEISKISLKCCVISCVRNAFEMLL